MIIDVINVKVLEGYNLLLQFNDGNSGQLDLSKIVEFKGIFAPLENYDYFSKVHINPDIGTICWDNGADIAPDFLYHNAVQQQDEYNA